MASIVRDVVIDAPPDAVWDALRDFGALHERLAPGFVVDCRMDGPDARVVTFANRAVVREVLVGVDDSARRLAYSVVEGPAGFTHHNASAQVFAEGRAGTRFVWIADLLPDELAMQITELMELGLGAIRRALEGADDATARIPT